MQRLENREVGQRLPARIAETARNSSASALPGSMSARRKRSNSASSTGRLHGGDRGVIDQIGVARRRDRRRRGEGLRRLVLGEPRHGGHIDIEIVRARARLDGEYGLK